MTRIRPERNEWRFYRMEIWPDLFGRTLLSRQWGRIGTQGRTRLDPYPDAGAAINALARLAQIKRLQRLSRVRGIGFTGRGVTRGELPERAIMKAA